MQKIIIPFNGNSPEEIEKLDGVITSVNWDALLPTISEFSRLRPYEVIDGLVVTDTDIKVKISRKKGPKKKVKTVLPAEPNIDDGPF